jgi:hypothetical protein
MYVGQDINVTCDEICRVESMICGNGRSEEYLNHHENSAQAPIGIQVDSSTIAVIECTVLGCTVFLT